MSLDVASIERAADDVLLAHEVRTPRVDPFHIARLESIRLAPGNYDGCFDSRLEYRRTRGIGTFYLFYAEPCVPSRPEGRVRFSIAHELGHFYLPEHRNFVLSGIWHGSRTDFLSTKETEREADYFAASLLMPRTHFADYVLTKARGKCSMSNLDTMARDVFHSSLSSTAIRYVQMDFEPCTVVVSENGLVRFSICSDSMRSRGLGWITPRSRVPNGAITRRLRDQVSGPSSFAEGPVSSEIWYPDRRPCGLWEEARVLGRTNLTLSLLVVNEDAGEEDDW